MEVEFIEDDEVLYRRIAYDRDAYQSCGSKCIKVTRSAFLDARKQPSVDRAARCNNDPHYTQLDERDGVVFLIAKEVRQIDDMVKQTADGKVEVVYTIDVVHRPIENNLAHAQIEPNPSITSDSVYRRLRTRLAWLVNNYEPRWLILPESYR